MDRRVTAKFYEVVNTDAGRPLEYVIQRISEIENKRDREKDLGDDLTLRLEHFEVRDGFIIGDLTRIQTENLPGHVTDEDTEELPIDELGHYIGFCYDPNAKAIAVQYHLQAQIGKVLSYFSTFDEHSEYGSWPLIREIGVDRIQEAGIRKFTVRVSGINDFRNSRLDERDGPVEEVLEHIADQLGAQTVELVVSIRASEGGLRNPSIVGTVSRLLRRRETTDSIKTLRAETFEGTDPLDFLEHPIRERDILDLPQNDPTEGRRRRLGFLYNAYERNRPTVYQVLGVERD